MIEIAGGILLAVAALVILVLFWRFILALAAVAAALYVGLVIYALNQPPETTVGDPWAAYPPVNKEANR